MRGMRCARRRAIAVSSDRSGEGSNAEAVDVSRKEALGARLSRLDRWGIVISSACLAHCLALPFVIALLPAIASSLPPDSWIHPVLIGLRSEEHTSELQSLMRISYAVFCLK